VGELVWRLAREFDQPDDASDLAIEGLTLELLAFFVRGERARDGRREPRWMRRCSSGCARSRPSR
jgi:hypothetical protein